MKKRTLFIESIRLVWASAPGWATVNIVVSVLRGLLPLFLVFLIKLLIDGITGAVSSGTGTVSDIIPLIAAVVALYFLDELTMEFSGFVRKKQALKLESYMYQLLHQKSIRIDLINFENPDYFDALSRAAREAPWRPNNILNNLVSLFRGGISLILMAGLLLAFEWWLVVLMLLVNIPAIWLRFHFADEIYNFQKKQTPEARKSAYFNWLLTGDRPARELRLFGLGEYFTGLFRESFSRHKEKELDIIKRRTTIELVSIAFKSAALLLVLLYVAKNTITGRLTLGEMAMFLFAFRQAMTYLRDIFGSAGALYEDSLFINDVFDFLKLKENITGGEVLDLTGEKAVDLEADKLSFVYPGGTVPVINNLSLKIKPGEIVAIVGHNGAGKSTLVKLLTRLYEPGEGKITCAGKNIRTLDPEKYRKNFSVVFQDFMLYNLSAFENIRLGDIEKPSADDVRRYAAETGMDELLRGLPHGYDTVIGNLFDDSRELSWGEWQKMALARALFRSAPVLILDEPSSALDAESEHFIFSRLKDLVKGKTTILITHRFTNVHLADRIVVMEKGSITETGSHEELMAQKGSYYNMYTKQSSRYTDEKRS